MAAKRGQLVNAGHQLLLSAKLSPRKSWLTTVVGTTTTAELTEALILAISQSEDSLDNKLFNGDIQDIWTEQKKHIKCKQDPPGIYLLPIPCASLKRLYVRYLIIN